MTVGQQSAETDPRHRRVGRLIGASQGRRIADDWYATPPAVTRALLAAEHLHGPILEPACGDGAISRVLEAAGHRVVSRDLVDRGYGEARRDFLLDQGELGAFPCVVTNPPFGLATDFARRALAVSSWKVCLLLKLAFLEGQARRDVLGEPLARVHVFARRISLAPGGREAEYAGRGGMMAFGWFVWERGWKGPAQLHRIEA